MVHVLVLVLDLIAHPRGLVTIRGNTLASNDVVNPAQF